MGPTFPEHNKATFIALLMSDVPHRQAMFFVDICDKLRLRGELSLQDMANLTGISAPAASSHVRLLEKLHVLERVHYRAWREGPWLSERSKNFVLAKRKAN